MITHDETQRIRILPPMVPVPQKGSTITLWDLILSQGISTFTSDSGVAKGIRS